MEGASESRKENQTKGGQKKVLYKCPQKISRYQNKKFFGTDLKINIMGEESIVWKYTYQLQVAS